MDQTTQTQAQDTQQSYSDEIKMLLKKPDKYRDFLLKLMIDNNASDMYLTYWEPPALRVYGKVYRINQFPPLDDDVLTGIAYMFMDEFEGEHFRQNLDIDLWWSAFGRRYRLNISKQQKHIMIVARLLAEKIPTIDELGLPLVFKELIRKTSGIILVAGPTWSGKSTTLAAMIEEINVHYAKHIITIEDPIEYVFEPKEALIEQKQLGSDVLSFAKALKAALRQKPDVILFGEMRDLESIKNAITLAETWHLVLSTIHSKSSAQTINKIIDSFPADQQNQIRIQLAETLASVISQRLLRRKNGKGMVPAFEIMINNTAVANLIRENQIKQINNVIQTNRSAGMVLLEDSLIELIEKGEVDVQAALALANDSSYLLNELKNRWIWSW